MCPGLGQGPDYGRRSLTDSASARKVRSLLNTLRSQYRGALCKSCCPINKSNHSTIFTVDQLLRQALPSHCPFSLCLQSLLKGLCPLFLCQYSVSTERGTGTKSQCNRITRCILGQQRCPGKTHVIQLLPESSWPIPGILSQVIMTILV